MLTLHLLELRQGDWYPEADAGPSMKIYAFAEEEQKHFKYPVHSFSGVPEGTEIHVTLLPQLSPGHGGRARLASAPGRMRESSCGSPSQENARTPIYRRCSLRHINTTQALVEPWATPVVRFEKTVSLQGRSWWIPPGKVTPDRIFVLGIWRSGSDRRGTYRAGPPPAHMIPVINGKSGPTPSV